MDFQTVMISTVTALFTTYLAKGDSEAVRAIDNLTYLVAYPINYPAEKLKLWTENHFSEYVKKFSDKLDSVPEENRIEPPLEVIGLAIESSKFFIDVSEIRDMFINLMVSASDVTKADKVHTSYAKIIEQLSPHDAIVFKEIYRARNSTIVCGNIMLFEPPQSFMGSITHSGYKKVVFANLADPFHSLTDYEKTAISIINLKRLALIDVHNGKLSALQSDYDELLKAHLFDTFKSEHPETTVVDKRGGQHQRKIQLEHGYITLTQLGKYFYDCCLS